MAQLNVENFSCISKANLSVAPLTILVGPQASGKSLLSKLIYFFNDILRQQGEFARDGETLKTARERVAKAFTDWFPPSTWGSADFSINYTAGAIEYHVGRKKARGSRPSEDVIVTFSEFFSQQYVSLLQRYIHLKRKSVDNDDDEIYAGRLSTWEMQRTTSAALRKSLGSEYLQSQVFIPAGRAFFTNLGKAFAVLEHGGRLDTITSRFGTLYASLIDEGFRYFVPNDRASRAKAKSRQEKRLSAMKRLFGGQLKIGANKQLLETKDGRIIPFSLLSSGQQELVPLWLTLTHFTRLREFTSSSGYNLLFIEEPEAHLFPAAQSFLVEYLATVVVGSEFQSRMLLSTHSPYVLAKINNLMKAQSLGAAEGQGEDVAEIVPEEAWLPSGSVHAYAIRNREVESIMGADGLIDATYLDEISEEISSEFMSLLEIEVASEH
jgi:hypothetical protein